MNESENSLVTELGICFIWDIKGERAIKKEDSLFLGNYKTQESKHKITSGKEMMSTIMNIWKCRESKRKTV